MPVTQQTRGVGEEEQALRLERGGQLEGELEANAWVVVPGEPEDVLGDPSDLWRRVLRRQGGTTAWLANAPVDPSLN